MKSHATGITLALAAALAVGLSLAPIPDALKPFPGLRTEPPAAFLARILVPSRGGAVHAQDALTGAPDKPPSSWSSAAAEDEAPSARDEAVDAALAGLPAVGDERLWAGLPAWEVRKARALDHWAERAGARHVDIEEGCRQPAPGGACARRALDDFFDRLEPLRQGHGAEAVRIVHLGDSQIASDHIADLIRRRLEHRYGSSGRGFLFVDRPTRFSGRKARTGDATEGWEISKITDGARSGVYGFSGVRFTAPDARQATRFEARGARFADVAFVAGPSGGAISVEADGRHLSRILTRLDAPTVAFSRVRIPAGAGQVALSAGGGPVALLGAALESGAPGVVYDTIGLPGAMHEVFLRAPERSFVAHLARRDPSLVVLMLGGNEAYEIGRGWQKLDDVRRNARALLDRVRKASPRASCLVLAPLDAGVRSVSGEIAARAHGDEVGAALREVALSSGCAFWDALAAMGGPGAAGRWYQLDLFHPDLVHPRARGADLLGHLLESAVERARQSRPGQFVSRVEGGAIEDPASSLAPFFERLRAGERGSGGPDDGGARVVVLGPAHAAPVPDGEAPWHFAAVNPLARTARPAELVVLAAAASAPGDADEEAKLRAALTSARAAAPSSACLVVGPPDRLRPIPGGGLAPDEDVDRTALLARKLAAEEGCAFWSARGAMGGRGASRRWATLHPPLAAADGGALTPDGEAALSRALGEELLSAYRASVTANEARAQAGGGGIGGAP